MTQQMPIDPSTEPPAPAAVPDKKTPPEQYQQALLPQIASIPFDALANSISAEPSTHIRAGMGYKYERSAPIGDNALQVERIKVQSLQKALLAIDKDLLGKIGWNTEKEFCDGIFGQKTIEALKLFQQSNNLPTTGILDKNTADAIVKQLASQSQQAQGNPQPPAQPGPQAGQQVGSPQSPGHPSAGDGRLQPQQELSTLLALSKGTRIEKEVADLVSALYQGRINEAPQIFEKIVQAMPEHQARFAQKTGRAAVSELISILGEGRRQ